jgi:hypothetical protein
VANYRLLASTTKLWMNSRIAENEGLQSSFLAAHDKLIIKKVIFKKYICKSKLIQLI